VLESLISSRPVTGLVMEGFSALNTLACSSSVTLHWIAAHRGYVGNETADRMAKEACVTRYLGPQPSIAIPYNAVRKAIRLWTEALHAMLWHGLNSCKHSKMFFPNPYGGKPWRTCG